MKKTKSKKFQAFDREGFFLGLGLGLFMLLFGAFLFWAISTVPEGATPSQLHPLTTSQRIGTLIPYSAQQPIALLLSVLFILFGLFCIVFALGTVVKYCIARLRARGRGPG